MNISIYTILMRRVRDAGFKVAGFGGQLFRRVRDASYAGIAILALIAVVLYGTTVAYAVNSVEDRPGSYDESKEFNAAIEHYEVGNYAKAREIWSNAAARGGVKSQYRLGEVYEHGAGVEKDLVEAHLWYSLAADSASLRAERALFRIENLMTDEQIINAQMLVAEFSPIYAGVDSSSNARPAQQAQASIDVRLFTAIPASTQQQPVQLAQPPAGEPEVVVDVRDSSGPDELIRAKNNTAKTSQTSNAVRGSATPARKLVSTSEKDSVTTVALHRREDVTKSPDNFNKRRLQLLKSSGPGPQIVSDPVEVTKPQQASVKAAEVTKPQQAPVKAAHAAGGNKSENTADEDTARAGVAATEVNADTTASKRSSDQAETDTLQEQVAQPAEQAENRPEPSQPAAASNTATEQENQSNDVGAPESGSIASKAEPTATSDRDLAARPDAAGESLEDRASEDAASNLQQLVDEADGDFTQVALAPAVQPTKKIASIQPPVSGFSGVAGDRQGVERIQVMLKELGYQIDEEAGQIGPQTRKAIQAFRRDSALLVSTVIDVDFLATLYRRHAAITQ